MSVEIKAMKGGPCVIMGSATYIDADGNEQTTPGKAIALCRCGQSANKPFCDGTHSAAGFEASEIVLTLDAE
ncbi:MAG: CDGSH iron-sulfur domain-containing protein [Chloroflexota bacterium]